MTNKIWTIFTSILGVVILSLGGYIIIQQPKVNAAEEIIAVQNRIDELDKIIEDAKKWYDTAMESKNECISSWNEQAEEEHRTAEKARAEKKQLEGFLLNR